MTQIDGINASQNKRTKQPSKEEQLLLRLDRNIVNTNELKTIVLYKKPSENVYNAAMQNLEDKIGAISTATAISWAREASNLFKNGKTKEQREHAEEFLLMLVQRKQLKLQASYGAEQLHQPMQDKAPI